MKDDFYHKYLKYKTKYLQLKKLLGGGIDDFKTMFHNEFGSDWILTGSEAIKLYLIHFNRPDLLTFTPNDIDIIYINKNMIYRENINGFKREQSQPEKSMTFSKGSTSFDVSTVDNAYYYEINNIKLMSPELMLDNYEENLELRNNPSDNAKIKALKEIKKLISESGLEKKRLPIKEVTTTKFFSPDVSKRRALFDDDDDSNSPKIPKLSRNLF